MRDFSKVVLISCAFFFFYLLLGTFNYTNFGLVNNSVDFFVHWNKVNDLNFKSGYPSTYHFIFQVFSSNQLLFYSANLFLICLIIPFLLFVLTKTYWSAILYFCGVSLPHLWLFGSTFPQAFVFMLVLVYLVYRKNLGVFLFTCILASLVHKEGVYLFGLILFAEVIEFAFSKVKGIIFPYVILNVQKFESIQTFVFFVITQISLPVLFFSKSLLRNIFYFVLCLVPLFLLNFDARIISVTQLGLLVVVSPEIVKSKHKKLIAFILLFYLIFFLMDFAVGTTKLFYK